MIDNHTTISEGKDNHTTISEWDNDTPATQGGKDNHTVISEWDNDPIEMIIPLFQRGIMIPLTMQGGN